MKTLMQSAFCISVALAVTTASGAEVSNVPLWRIPPGEFNAMQKKPLFSPSRRPPPVVEAQRPVAAPQAAVEVPPPAATLIGVLTGPDNLSIAILATSGSGRPERLQIGDVVQDWTLTGITRTQVFLRAQGRTITLAMQPRTKGIAPRAANNATPNQYGD